MHDEKPLGRAGEHDVKRPHALRGFVDDASGLRDDDRIELQPLGVVDGQERDGLVQCAPPGVAEGCASFGETRPDGVEEAGRYYYADGAPGARTNR